MEQDGVPETWVYVFNGADPQGKGRASFPGGVFSSRETAEAWIVRHRLSGVLTAYPLDEGAYDWAVEHGWFKPKRDDQRTPAFVGRFGLGYRHWHYEDGVW